MCENSDAGVGPQTRGTANVTSVVVRPRNFSTHADTIPTHSTYVDAVLAVVHGAHGNGGAGRDLRRHLERGRVLQLVRGLVGRDGLNAEERKPVDLGDLAGDGCHLLYFRARHRGHLSRCWKGRS